MKVSVCIPVYNMSHCIERAVRSALGQDFDDFEVLVVDNGSTDGTWEILSKLSAPNLRVIQNETNLGCYGNHNSCLAHARGEWIKFLHGDDELLPDCLTTMYAAAQKCPENTGLIGCGAIHYGYDDTEAFRTPIPDRLFIFRPAPPQEFYQCGNIVGTPTMVMIHRELTLKVGGFDLALEPGADGDMWTTLRKHYYTAIMSAHKVIVRDDLPDNLQKRVAVAVKLFKRACREIDKWARIENSGLTDYRQIDARFRRWFCNETYRYWWSSLKYAAMGRFELLRAVWSELSQRRLALVTFASFIGRSIGGRLVDGERSMPWSARLSHLEYRPT